MLCIINRIICPKQYTLHVNCHARKHWHGLRRTVRNKNNRKIQNENICLRRESNQRPLAFQPAALELYHKNTFWTWNRSNLIG